MFRAGAHLWLVAVGGRDAGRRTERRFVKTRQAVAKGLDYLRKTQETDGSWGHYPATTALAVSAFLRNGRTELNDPAVAKGIQFLLGRSKPNGAIYSDANAAPALPNYNTSLAVDGAGRDPQSPPTSPSIQKAQQYLAKVAVR